MLALHTYNEVIEISAAKEPCLPCDALSLQSTDHMQGITSPLPSHRHLSPKQYPQRNISTNSTSKQNLKENMKQKDPTDHRKPCTLCSQPRDVLVRCQIDETGKWHFVCPGSCWKSVSGGVIDGDGGEGRKGYRYGGMWKNKHEGASARMPRKVKGRLRREREGREQEGPGGEGEEEGGGNGCS